MKTIKIPIRKYRDNAISKPQNSFNHFPLYGGFGMRKCHAMPGIRAKGAPVMMSRCAPQKKCKTLSMSSAARPESAVMKYEENCLQNEQMNFESNLCEEDEDYYQEEKMICKEKESEVKKKKKVESSVSATSSAVTQSSSQSNYQEIVSLQEIDGSFKSLPDKYKSLVKKEWPVELEELVKTKDSLSLVWTTIITLAVLERDCKSSKGEWAMIAKKAKAYLKKLGVQDFSKFAQID